MVTRTILAFDNEVFLIDPSSPFGNAGAPIVNASNTPNGTIFQFQGGSRVTVEIDDTSGDPDVFEDDQAFGHTVIDGGGLVADGNGVEAESLINLRELDSNGNPTGPVIQVTVFSQNGQFFNIWGLSTAATLTPGALYTRVSGSIFGSASYDDVVCFCKGTMIATTTADIAVEGLTKGSKVTEVSGRTLVVRAVFRTFIDGDQLHRSPNLRPVRISAGALGNGLPKRDLWVSRQHRMLVSSRIAERMFGARDVLIPAIKLTELPGIYIDDSVTDVEYFHILFDQHEVIFAEGAPSESLFTGPEALKSVSESARAEIFEIFPKLHDENFTPEPAATMPPGQQQKRLIARHLKNNKPLLEVN